MNEWFLTKNTYENFPISILKHMFKKFKNTFDNSLKAIWKQWKLW